MRMAGWWFAGALILAACSPPARYLGDDAGSGSCGDGVVSVGPPLFEECDLGSANGTAGTNCTRECLLARPVVDHFFKTGLDRTPSSAVRTVSWITGYGGFAYLDSTENQIGIVGQYISADEHSPTVFVSGTSPIKTLGTIGTPSGIVPAWVERDVTDLLHLFYAEISTTGPIVVHELPYPFPDGSNPRMLVDDTGIRFASVLMDQSKGAADLLVAVLTLNSDGDLNASTARFAAPSPSPGYANATTYSSGSRSDQQIVQFFTDPGAFVAIDTIASDMPPTLSSTYSILESGRGAWPFKVIDATRWGEGGPQTNCPPQNQVIPPLAMLTETGDVYIWPFPEIAKSEMYFTPYATFAPGTSMIFGQAGGAVLGLLAIEPDGSQAIALDSDCEDSLSPSLGVQRSPGLAPWSSSVRLRGMSSWCCGNAVLDDQLIWW